MSRLAQKAKEIFMEGGEEALKEFLLGLSSKEQNDLLGEALDQIVISVVSAVLQSSAASARSGLDIAGASLKFHSEYEERNVPYKGFSHN